MMEMTVMDMYFYWGSDVVYLFEAWKITGHNVPLFVTLCAVTFGLAVFTEFLKSRLASIKNLALSAFVYLV